MEDVTKKGKKMSHFKTGIVRINRRKGEKNLTAN